MLAKAKDGKSTVLTAEIIQEINKFTEALTSDKAWPIFCVRDYKQEVVDGWGCTANAYQNITKYITPLLNNLGEIGVEQRRRIAPLILNNDVFRQQLGKEFTLENPDSKIIASALQTTGNPLITRNEDGKEVLVESMKDKKNMMQEFA